MLMITHFPNAVILISCVPGKCSCVLNISAMKNNDSLRISQFYLKKSKISWCLEESIVFNGMQSDMFHLFFHGVFPGLYIPVLTSTL